MVHKHFEEHKNQLFAGKKLKKHDGLPKGQKKKNKTKVLFRGIRHVCSIRRKIPLSVSLRTLYCGMLPTGRTSLMLSRQKPKIQNG